MNITVFASHGGSDMQAIIDGCKAGKINAKVVAMIGNNADSMAIKRAEKEGIDHYYLSHKEIEDADELERRMLEVLESHDTDFIFLAGYMRKLGDNILKKYENRIFNIHPALLPKYGGRGMYGIHVHEAVIAAGEKVSGVTIHRVNNEYDSGDIIAQTEVPVLEGDTAETLAARVLKREHEFLVEVVGKIANGEVPLGR
ncbi:MAG TPA: phosphoribosylglycinamide formyltransferase [Lachnospiraceae bacterium]|jgi:phosphoribosylglycinamide formyltransferase 1|nr:phosphoribosylglycinamide formyltransferase [Lachnospiraceae bacterium]